MDATGKMLRDLQSLAILGERLVKRANRKAVRAMGREVIKDARRRVPRRYGDLKKSLGIKVKAYRRTGVALAIIGPRRGRARPHPTRPGKMINPTNYAHLVELGTRRTSPQPFLRPAEKSAKPAAVAAAAKVYEAELKKELRK